MKKLAITIIAIITIGGSVHTPADTITLGGNFTMLSSGSGVLIGGTNDVVFTWDGTFNNAVVGAISNATLSSDEAFFGSLWDAHDVTIYGPGDYTVFDGCNPGDAGCGVGNAVDFTVSANQIGAHMLIDWPEGSTQVGNINMDVINVWNHNTTWGIQNPTNPFFTGLDNGSGCTTATEQPDCVIDGLPNTNTTVFGFVSTDFNDDGIAGAGMTDGAFVGSHPNFNLSPVPVPAAFWLFSSGLLGLVSMGQVVRRHKQL